jgi:hypothetical protein
MSISVLEASQPGNTQADRRAREHSDANYMDEQKRKALITESGNKLMTKESIAAFEQNKKDGERKYPYAGQNQRRSSFSLKDQKELQALIDQKTTKPSSCAVMGGKRRKTRKQRGSRKNKKSRRR